MSPNFPSFNDFLQHRYPLAVVGLGYVGLPLAVAFAKHVKVTGFDISQKRISELTAGHDRTGESNPKDLNVPLLSFTNDPAELAHARVLIVAVPTPIDAHRNPDLTPVIKASETVSRCLSQGSIVVYESTVYPGVTEETCVPILEKGSGLRYGVDFTVGYSPERINPGDHTHTLETVVKIVSGSDRSTLRLLADLYGLVAKAGIYQASSIKVAEAAKVIENTQRDLNIALMNELSLIFEHLGIDTLEVLQAAGTKWNFLPFRPGLVGGHCIGVDPYYLTFKAEESGYHPQVILAGRRINDSMGKYVAEMCVKQLIRCQRMINGARVGIMGFTFKENVPDLRNTRVIDIVRDLQEYGVSTLVSDPLVDFQEVQREYGLQMHELQDLTALDALIVAVPHEVYAKKGELEFSKLRSRFADSGKPLLMDIKGILNAEAAKNQGFAYWRL